MKKFSAVSPLLMLLVLLISSCEKVIDVDLNNAEPVFVIEGIVSNRTDSQLVKISRSVPFGEPNAFNGISGATVTVTDNRGEVYNFPERSPGIYSSRRLVGIPGNTYTLKVLLEGQEYVASSTMPQQVLIDSIGVSVTTFFDEERKSVQLLFPDPPGIKNYYRFRLEVNGVRSRNIFAYNDDFNDGNKVNRELFDFDLELESGDQVEVEMNCIDANIYRYLQGLDQNENRGGASTTPANPKSNISNGALGYFSAQTSQREGITIP